MGRRQSVKIEGKASKKRKKRNTEEGMKEGAGRREEKDERSVVRKGHLLEMAENIKKFQIIKKDRLKKR